MTTATYPFNNDGVDGDDVTVDLTGDLTGDATGDVTGDDTGDAPGDVAIVDEYTALPSEAKEQTPMSALMTLEAPVQSFDWNVVIWNLDPRTNDIKYSCHFSLDKNC